jgi:hypothetical protein
MSVFLKVKVKSLAEEAKIIRKEEDKGYCRVDLECHRKSIVRRAARETLIAYGFLRGREYRQIELNTKTQPDWKKVKAMVDKYWFGGREWKESKFQKEDFEKWMKES